MSDLGTWLERLELERFLANFAENEVELTDLPELSDRDLKELGLPLGPRRRILKAIREIDGAGSELAAQSAHAAIPIEPESPDPPAIEAERRQLTIMFVDLVGSTALSERLDPEEMREAITAFQRSVAGVVTRFEGNIAKYMGDGVLCYFGWPQAHEDDAERAVRAGLGIMKAMANATAPGDETLTARAGVATGLVVVGDLVGDGAAQEEAVVGQTPNLAARLQTLAQPGQLVIAESTRRLLSGLFDFADLGKQSLKGIAGLVSAYAVRGERVGEGRFDTQRAGGETDMVGREQELALLIDRWRQAAAGEEQMVLLTGEAGIGKSRIAHGLFGALADTDHVHIRYQCSPYHMDSALFPATQQLVLAAGFHAEDLPEARLDKLENLLARAGADVSRASPLIASLLGLGEAAEIRYGALDYSPQQQRMKTLEELVNQLQGLSAYQPVLFTVEDAHWIDPTTLELIELCLDRIDEMKVMMLVTARPTFEYGFDGHPNVTRLALNRLGRSQVRDIVARITKGKAIPSALLDEIAAKTDGVPLFVEEFTKTVLESPALRETEEAWVLDGPMDSIVIPTSLHDSLMARLDRLQSVKEVAQTAACIGREFDHQLLSQISPLSAEGLKGALGRLIEAELLFRRGVPPNETYIFKHALVRDAAYESLLRSSRKQVHARIATAIQERFPEVLQNNPEVLAHHCTEAGLIEEAIGFWQKAGERAAERSAGEEASAHLTKALKLTSQISDMKRRSEQELALQIALAPVLMLTKGFGSPQVQQAYLRARDLCRQVGDPTQLFMVNFGLWHVNQNRGDFKGAEAFSDEVLTLAREQGDPAFLLQAHHAAWTTRFHLADQIACHEHTCAGRALYDAEAHRSHKFIFGGHDPGVCALNHGALTTWLLGYPDQAICLSRDAIILAQELGHAMSLVLAHCFASFLHQFRAEPQAVLDRAEAVLEICTEQGIAPHYDATGRIMRGWAIAELGQPQAGAEEMRESLADLAATEMNARRPHYLSMLAEAEVLAGHAERGLSALAEAEVLIKRTGERRWEAEVYRLTGELLDVSGASGAEVEACFQRALETAAGQQARSLQLRAATSLARQWQKSNKEREAFGLLAPVYDWFKEGFETADLKAAKTLLDEFS